MFCLIYGYILSTMYLTGLFVFFRWSRHVTISFVLLFGRQGCQFQAGKVREMGRYGRLIFGQSMVFLTVARWMNKMWGKATWEEWEIKIRHIQVD